jgi:hypothetical protein
VDGPIYKMIKSDQQSGVLALLRVVRLNQPAESLIQLGYTYGQIAQLISTALDNKWLYSNEIDLSITASGSEKLYNSNTAFGPRGWIEPDPTKVIEVLPPNEIYLPSERTARKLRSSQKG